MRLWIIVISILVGIIPIVIFKNVLLATYEKNAVQQKIIEIQTQGNVLGAQISKNSYLENPNSDIINAEITQMASIYNGRILLINNEFEIVKDSYTLDVGKYLVAEEIFRAMNGETVSKYYKEEYIESAIPIIDSKTKEVCGVLVINYMTDAIESNLEGLARSAMILQIAIGSVVIAGSVLVSVILTKPFKKITNSIEQITEGLDGEINMKGYLETERISDAFNKMLEQMRHLDKSRQEFVSNVSHELKTPITSIKVLADSLIAQEDVPNELYKEFMVDIAEEIDRESKIINDLLSLVKMDKAAADMNISEVKINELVELILKRLRPIAAKRNVELVFESFRPITAEIDEVKLTLAISNIVENAIKYNVEDGWVRVSLNADHKYFYIKVSDSGIGMSEEDQKHIFERFYRVDKARSSSTGGTGLGLAITRNVVLMHRGAIKVYSKENEGTTFTVRVPLIYIA
jgi:signal transduction histidine kinase